KKRLNIIPIASHSNFRKVQNNNRNLSDEFAKEILKRGGIIGINFVCSMVGNSSRELIKHIEHAIYLKLKDNICFGADFFDDLDFPKNQEPFFFDDVQNAESYPYILDFLSNHFDKSLLEKLSNKNALQFFRKQKVIE
ncbi:MAG: membrane dipeptidase, partial [Chlamydiae bacterium]|nr:membrane dipeptidase [Chlamydiota bacterium]